MDAYQRGAEWMREKALEAFDEPDGYFDVRNVLRSLPLPPPESAKVKPMTNADVEAIERIDQVVLAMGLEANHPMMLDYARIKFLLKRIPASSLPEAKPAIDVNAFVDEYMKGIAGPPESLHGLRYHIREAVAKAIVKTEAKPAMVEPSEEWWKRVIWEASGNYVSTMEGAVRHVVSEYRKLAAGGHGSQEETTAGTLPASGPAAPSTPAASSETRERVFREIYACLPDAVGFTLRQRHAIHDAIMALYDALKGA